MFSNHITTFPLAILVLTIIYLVLDFLGPARIFLRKDYVFGMPCERAKDLIVQEYDNEGNLWATRGMVIYILRRGDNYFSRVAHAPTGPSVFWLYNFSIFRKFSLRPECMEIVTGKSGTICAFSGGSMWYRPENTKKFKQTMKLSHYGIGVGRGMLSNGIFSKDNTIFFGEYFDNPDKTSVRIYKSPDNGLNWEIAHEFFAGQIRHIHSLYSDPYSDKLWICTGDLDNESIIGWSGDNYMRFLPIVQGSQVARAIALVFTEDSVFWGTDTGSGDHSGIYRWYKETKKIVKLQKISAAMFYGTRLAGGTIVMSSEIEGSRLESDDKTRLFIINNNGDTATIECGSWNLVKKGFRFSPARLRLQRYQGSNSLAVTCLNQREISNGSLIIISEEVLISTSIEKLTNLS